MLPLYQAITSVKLGDGLSTSFWRDVWFEDDALADVYPALFSHCSNQDVTVSQVLQSSLQFFLVPRLSNTAANELVQVNQIISSTVLSNERDKRITPFSKKELGLDSGSIYRLLKARGQPPDERAVFVWSNVAPPRVQMFMWLLTPRGEFSAGPTYTANMFFLMPFARYGM